jgi:hypothetical protein
VSVRIGKEYLYRAIGPKFSIMNQWNSLVFEQLSRGTGVNNFECEMVAATVLRAIASRSRGAALIVFFDQVQERCTSLKPGSGKGKSRTLDFIHSEQFNVECATGIQVFYDNR